MQAALNVVYSGQSSTDEMGRDALTMVQTLSKLDPNTYHPAHSAHYPASEFGVALQQAAMLIKAEVGLEVAAIDHGGWDTHFAQATQMLHLLQDLSDGLGAFYTDLHDHMQHMTLVVMSEFGCWLQESGSLGTDHGHGSMMMLLGGHVLGGKVHGRWPGLNDGQLVGPGDLAVTTDYRDVLAEVCRTRLGTERPPA